MKNFFSVVILFVVWNIAQPQNAYTQAKPTFTEALYRILHNSNAPYPFSGLVLIQQDTTTLYAASQGYARNVTKTPFSSTSQFVVGSISKQFTGVLVLREVESKRLDLFAPIRQYLPELQQAWADTITAHHLLTHTHGITSLTEPSSFPAGTRFAYSQRGYELLSRIVSATSGKSFADCAQELFRLCGMTQTFHPAVKQYKNLVQGYTRDSTGTFQQEQASLENYPAAGSFISTARDLARWNRVLYSGQLLSPRMMQLLTTTKPNATRQHPLFGKTEYSYGITIDSTNQVVRLGNTGFAPGFASMNFYFPAVRTSVIVLSNTDCCSYKEDLATVFAYHTAILEVVRQYCVLPVPKK